MQPICSKSILIISSDLCPSSSPVVVPAPVLYTCLQSKVHATCVTCVASLDCIIVPAFGAVPVAARSKAWFCGRSSAETRGSNPTVEMSVCLLCVVR